MSRVVLDSSALMALLDQETGASLVAEHVMTSVVSAANLSELVTKLCARGMQDADLRGVLAELAFEVIAFDEAQAYRCGLLSNSTKKFGLSLGDRACLSLARMLDLPAMTSDRAWGKLELGVTVEVIR